MPAAQAGRRTSLTLTRALSRSQTGMPIKAASDKLIREMEMFGKDFENYGAPAEAEETVRLPPSLFPCATSPCSTRR